MGRHTTRLLLAGVLAAIVGAAAAAPTQAAAPIGAAQITAEQRIAPRVVELTISTPAFTTPTHVLVDLPTGYDTDPDRRWPVTYALAGTQNTYRTFNEFVDGVGLTASYPGIVVSPNGDSGYWSDWYNDGAGGAPMYETYVIDQLIPLIDAHFRTIADRAHRTVMGISMGGYGAMMVAARHPDLFAAAASLSGAVDSNLIPNGPVLSISSSLQGGKPDAIYGPRLTQEVRWRGHNPVDLVDNLRDVDLQVRTANGVLNPGIGENPLSADALSCVVEKPVYNASISLHDTLTQRQMPHLWKDYGDGCHTVANFTREIADTLTSFTTVLAHPAAPPSHFDYASIEPAFDVYGWDVTADPRRALEFLRLKDAGATGLTLTGSGTTTVTTPPLFRGLRKVDAGGTGGTGGTRAPDAQGRITFTVALGPPDVTQQYTVGATTKQTTKTVTFRPWAQIPAPRVRATRTQMQVCATAAGGTVAARIRVTGKAGRTLARSEAATLTAKSGCWTLRRSLRLRDRQATVAIRGTDRFGHAVGVRRTVRLPAP